MSEPGTHRTITRRDFLRAGSARVVLTIRPGFEPAFTALIEAGSFSKELPPNHPYMEVAKEIEHYAETHYAGSEGTHSLANANSTHAVSQYDVACYQVTQHH